MWLPYDSWSWEVTLEDMLLLHTTYGLRQDRGLWVKHEVLGA